MIPASKFRTFSRDIPRHALITLAVFALVFTIAPYSVSADTKPIDLQTYIPGIGLTTTDLPTYLAGLYKFAVGAAGIVALLAMIWGGYKWMFARGNAAQVEDARETIGSAVLGLILVFSSYVILSLINPKLIELNIAVSPAGNGINQAQGKVSQVCAPDSPGGDYVCGSVYYPNLSQLSTKCANYKGEELAKCTQESLVGGCMGVKCSAFSDDQVCYIPARDGAFLTGTCLSSLTIYNRVEKAATSITTWGGWGVPPFNPHCGDTGLTAGCTTSKIGIGSCNVGVSGDCPNTIFTSPDYCYLVDPSPDDSYNGEFDQYKSVVLQYIGITHGLHIQYMQCNSQTTQPITSP